MTSIERGYSLTYYDYANDLSVRDIIQAIADDAPVDLREKILTIVQPSDALFRRATVQVPNAFHTVGHGTDGWWWARKPIRITPDLDDAAFFRSQTLDELAGLQGVEPVHDISTLAIPEWPADESADDIIDAVRR